MADHTIPSPGKAKSNDENKAVGIKEEDGNDDDAVLRSGRGDDDKASHGVALAVLPVVVVLQPFRPGHIALGGAVPDGNGRSGISRPSPGCGGYERIGRFRHETLNLQAGACVFQRRVGGEMGLGLGWMKEESVQGIG